ncbi:MAG: hypothetical protein ABIP75_05180 [Pyrinomonadaceae bacterium]
MNPMHVLRNKSRTELRSFLRLAKYVLPVLAVLLYAGVTDVQISAGQTRKVTLVSYAGFTSGMQVQRINDQSNSWALRHTIISSERGSVDVPTSDPIRVYFQKLEANVRLNTFHTEIVDVPGDVCFKVEGTLASPNVSRCDESVGVWGPDVRQIRFQNEAWYDAQMTVTYYEDQTVGGTTMPTPKSIETGFINGLGGKYRLVNLPATVSLKMPIIIALQGSTTVRDSVWVNTIPANFTGNPVPCYKVWGTVLDPQGGACNDTPVAVPPTPPSAPIITSVNGESVSPAAQFERDCYNLVQNKVPYDTEGHTAWSPGNIVNLCKGTTNPQATISCFNTEMPRSGWSAASKFCSLNSAAVATAMPPTPPSSTTGASGQPTLVNRQAHDIDAKNGEVWIIGTQVVGNDYSIHKLIGGSWTTLDGAAQRIAVDGRGSAWVISSAGMIFRRINDQWVVIPGINDGPARDIAITNSGEVWLVTTRGSVSRYTGAGWTSPQGMNATRIDYFADTDTLQLVDTTGKRWTHESATSWVIAGDPSGLAADYADYAADSDGTRWAIDSSFNIWRLGRRTP